MTGQRWPLSAVGSTHEIRVAILNGMQGHGPMNLNQINHATSSRYYPDGIPISTLRVHMKLLEKYGWAEFIKGGNRQRWRAFGAPTDRAQLEAWLDA